MKHMIPAVFDSIRAPVTRLMCGFKFSSSGLHLDINCELGQTPFIVTHFCMAAASCIERTVQCVLSYFSELFDRS